MNVTEEMKDKWKNRKPGYIEDAVYKHAAVLLPLIEKEGSYHILFEIRADHLTTQPGEICFPGGGIEAEENPEEAALRETMEELLIQREQIEVLAPLDRLMVPANMIVFPFLGKIKDYGNTYSADEVEHIFTVPLSFFLTHEPECYQTRVKTIPEAGFPYDQIPSGEKYQWRQGHYTVLFYRYEDKVIWGMTAKILHSFVEMCCKEFPELALEIFTE